MADRNINDFNGGRRVGVYDPPIDILINDESKHLKENTEVVIGSERLRKLSNGVVKSGSTDEPFGLVAGNPVSRKGSNASRKSTSLDENALSVADTGGSRRASNGSGKRMSLEESTRLCVDDKGSRRGSSSSRKSNSLDEPMGLYVDQRGSRRGSNASRKSTSLDDPIGLFVDNKGSRRGSTSSRKSNSLDEFSGLTFEDAVESQKGNNGTNSDDFDNSVMGRTRSASDGKKSSGIIAKGIGGEDHIFMAGRRDNKSPRRLGRQISEDKMVMDLSNTSGDIIMVETRMQSIHSNDPGVYTSNGSKTVKQSSQEERGSGDSLVQQVVGSTESPARPPRLRTKSVPTGPRDPDQFLENISENISRGNEGKSLLLNSSNTIAPVVFPKPPVLVISNQVHQTSLGYSETTLSTISETDVTNIRKLDGCLASNQPVRSPLITIPFIPGRKKSKVNTCTEVKNPSRPDRNKTKGFRHIETVDKEKSSMCFCEVSPLTTKEIIAAAGSLKQHDTSNE
ncbi:unnamed protein product, partial [Meganyctiphanes norvegica]